LNDEASDSKRPLTTLSLSCLVVANMIGVGLFTTSGYTLGSLGSPNLVITMWAVAGLIAILGAICYGGLAKQVTESGGEYLFLYHGVHPLAGFMAGWISLVAGFSGAIGLSALAFASHLPGKLGEQSNAWAVGLIVVFTLVNLLGLRPAARFQNLLVIAKLAALVAFGLYGLAWLLFLNRGPELDVAPEAVEKAGEAAWNWGGIASSLMWISFSYAGYNAAVYIAGAARQCQASVPKAMVLGTAGVTLLYVLLNAIFVWAAPRGAIENQQEVALIAARFISGDWLSESLRVVILVSLATSVLAMVQTGPHVYAKMARDGLLPQILDSRNATPRVGIVLQAVIAIALIFNSEFLELLNYLAFLLSISSAATISCLLLPAYRGEPGRRPVPLWPWIPILFIAATLLIAYFALQYRYSNDPEGLAEVLGVLPLGVAVYFVMRFRKRRRPRDSSGPAAI